MAFYESQQDNKIERKKNTIEPFLNSTYSLNDDIFSFNQYFEKFDLNNVTCETHRQQALQALSDFHSHAYNVQQESLLLEKNVNVPSFRKSFQNLILVAIESATTTRMNIDKFYTNCNGSTINLIFYQKLVKDFEKIFTQLNSTTQIFKNKCASIIELSKQEPRGIPLDSDPTELLLQDKIEFNQSDLEQRNLEFTRIRHSIEQLEQIFKDVSALVETQGYYVDKLEKNTINSQINVDQAVDELTNSSLYKGKVSFRTLLFLLFLLVLLCTFAFLFAH